MQVEAGIVELEEELGTAMEEEKTAVRAASPFWSKAYTACRVWRVLKKAVRNVCRLFA